MEAIVTHKINDMKTFDEQLNFVLAQSYGLVTRMEQQKLYRSTRFNLSISELKLLDAVYRNREDGAFVGVIAQELYITPSSVTIAVNRLEKKGFVTRKRSKSDARQVLIELTEEGVRAARIHRRFHRSLANTIKKDITEEEQQILIKCIERMNEFIGKRIISDEQKNK